MDVPSLPGTGVLTNCRVRADLRCGTDDTKGTLRVGYHEGLDDESALMANIRTVRVCVGTVSRESVRLNVILATTDTNTT